MTQQHDDPPTPYIALQGDRVRYYMVCGECDTMTEVDRRAFESRRPVLCHLCEKVWPLSAAGECERPKA